MRFSCLFVFMFLGFCSFSQNLPMCGDALIKHQLQKKHPNVIENIESCFENSRKRGANKSKVVYEIPVVFHVVYHNDEQNISDEVIYDQLSILNRDFRRLNENANEARDLFIERAADTEIEFFLAGQDPEGNPTNGITRTFTDKSTFINFSIEDLTNALLECGFDLEDPEVLDCITESLGLTGGLVVDEMKSGATGGKDPWDTKKYLNIWVANLSLEGMGMDIPFLLGFAYPPIEAPNWPTESFPEELEEVDGIVLDYKVVGDQSDTTDPNYQYNNKGRTCVHEAGHYLGLRHIWADGDCSVDDGIQDTPPAASNSQPTMVNLSNTCDDLYIKDSCVDDQFPDMVENYMDYSIESCQSMFTLEQANLMRSMLEGPRRGLLDNQISNTLELNKPELMVFPNPIKELINIQSDAAIQSVKIFDIHGNLRLVSSNDSFSVSLLEEGVYYLQVDFKTSKQTLKLVKTK